MANIRSYTVAEHGERWSVLSVVGSYDYDSDDLGRGESKQIWGFKTEEAARLFASLRPQEDRLRYDLYLAQCEIRELKTIRGANRNLREVRAAHRKTPA